MFLSNAQLAVALESLVGDDLPLNDAAMKDLGVTADEVAEARAFLLRTGQLLRTKHNTYEVEDELARTLAISLAPEQLFVLQLQDRTLPQQQISYGRVGSAWGRHTLAEPGTHQFTTLATTAAVADSILADAHLTTGGSHAVPAERAPLAEVLSKVGILCLLATGPLPGHKTPPPSALSWVNAADGVWWINPAGPPETAQRCTTIELREKIAAMVASGGEQ